MQTLLEVKRRSWFIRISEPAECTLSASVAMVALVDVPCEFVHAIKPPALAQIAISNTAVDTVPQIF
jgi:hypothetical protein